eukprot:SAG31_NODE_1418_length_8439_cov_20.075540_6_plen_99_part_00
MLFFTFQLAMLGFAFFLSTMAKKSASATNVGFVVFLFGFVIQMVVQFGFPFSTGESAIASLLAAIAKLTSWLSLDRFRLGLAVCLWVVSTGTSCERSW